MGVNGGDIIFQLFALLSAMMPIVLIVWFILSWRKRSKQLDRIEKKLDERR